MRNFLIQQTFIQTLVPSKPISFWLDEFSKIVVILDSELQVSVFTYDEIFAIFKLELFIDLNLVIKNDESLLKEIATTKQIIYKNEDNIVFIFTESGKRVKITNNHESLQVTDKDIIAVDLSPNQENLVIISQDFKLYLFNFDFELINCCDLDDGEQSDVSFDKNVCKEASITWRGDNQYFATLFSINGGKKCLIRDLKLKVFKSPSKADGKIVFSLSEAPVQGLSNSLAWQPCGSVIAVYNEQLNKNLGTIQFAEKNGLRHGEFQVTTGFEDLITKSVGKSAKSSVKLMRWNMDLPLLCVNQV